MSDTESRYELDSHVQSVKGVIISMKENANRISPLHGKQTPEEIELRQVDENACEEHRRREKNSETAGGVFWRDYTPPFRLISEESRAI